MKVVVSGNQVLGSLLPEWDLGQYRAALLWMNMHQLLPQFSVSSGLTDFFISLLEDFSSGF